MIQHLIFMLVGFHQVINHLPFSIFLESAQTHTVIVPQIISSFSFCASLGLPAKNMNPRSMNGDRCKESDGKLLQEKIMECSVEAGGDYDTSWPHLEEEDYIVFCFTEDGDIHVVEDRKRGMSCGSDIEIYPENEQEMIISFDKVMVEAFL